MDENIKSAVFEIFHSPPSLFNINRTTWRQDDLQRVMWSERKLWISMHYLRRIFASAGYKWRKARTVLTSHDPEFREKLDRIRGILSNLRDEERFFSIDEYGPFSVQAKGGARLVGPNEFPSVPQRQKSKGSLIVTAALELSTNQITHFRSSKKDAEEIKKLLDLLVVKYKDCAKLYLSWDAASWHRSQDLFDHIEHLNERELFDVRRSPIIEVVPLPTSAQFLNVIESVFSGLSRAVIHNSNYSSAQEAFAAIDRYFAERNEHFLRNPQRAGRKIWGAERVPAEFVEGQNCKDPQWR